MRRMQHTGPGSLPFSGSPSGALFQVPKQVPRWGYR
jgi:hypothetical protein